MKALIVEDDKHIANLERLALEDIFDEIEIAFSGEDAMDKFENFNYDLVILDVMLPGKDGYELSMFLRDDPRFKNTKVVMVSAKSSDVDIDKGILIGADDYISKPFEISELIHVVNGVLG